MVLCRNMFPPWHLGLDSPKPACGSLCPLQPIIALSMVIFIFRSQAGLSQSCMQVSLFLSIYNCFILGCLSVLPSTYMCVSFSLSVHNGTEQGHASSLAPKEDWPRPVCRSLCPAQSYMVMSRTISSYSGTQDGVSTHLYVSPCPCQSVKLLSRAILPFLLQGTTASGLCVNFLVQLTLLRHLSRIYFSLVDRGYWSEPTCIQVSVSCSVGL